MFPSWHGGLQEGMAGPSLGDLECLKILCPRMYAEKLISARFLFVESDLLGFAIRNELVPLSSYVDVCERRSCRLRLLGPSEVFENSSFVWTMSSAWPGGRWRCSLTSPMAATCTFTEDGVTSPAPSTSAMGTLLYCGMTASHRLTSRSLTLPPTASSTRMTSRLEIVSSPCPLQSRGVLQ